jgi:hypothetical protein
LEHKNGRKQAQLRQPGYGRLFRSVLIMSLQHCSKIAEAEAVVSVNEKKWLVMHVQMRLDMSLLHHQRHLLRRREQILLETSTLQ